MTASLLGNARKTLDRGLALLDELADNAEFVKRWEEATQIRAVRRHISALEREVAALRRPTVTTRIRAWLQRRRQPMADRIRQQLHPTSEEAR